ncbi:MAG TPA: hypothetical protein VHP33_38030 [Polyangiaceae bacterium]|nr:hypothetical protein [Polyangiaceae bacterium]
MRRVSPSSISHCLLLVASLGVACSAESPSSSGAGGGSSTGGVGVAGAATAGSSGSPTTSGGAATTPSAGAAGQLGGAAGTAAGGSSASGGQQAGGAATNAGASSGNTAGSGGGAAGGGCIPTKTWGTADPSSPGPFEVVVEKDVGPGAGEPDALHDNMVPHFNVYRPKDVGQGYCHPVITWGNGTNDQPEPNPPGCPSGSCGHYKTLLNQLASHGFVVVASLSSQTAKGTPLPQVVGVDWMIAENANPASALYHRLDVAHIGATGHSQGGAATTMSGADPRIVAIAPICGSRANITLHGPALLLCGGADTTVPCSSVQTAYDSISTVPVMLGELAGVTHGSWIGSIKDPVMVGVTAWMRVHLMNDTANRSMFYGASCKTCSDSKWKIQRKMMDQ